MKIWPIKEGDEKELSTLHVEALPNTVSSKIGCHYLESLYRSIAKNKKNNCAFIAIENSKIVGVITATTNLELFQSQAKKDLSIKNYLLTLLSIITLKVSFLEILKRIQFENKLIKSYKKSYATIIILFVNKDQRRKGIASNLIKKILNFYSNKSENIYVDTFLKNKGAIKQHKIIQDSALLLFSKKQND